MGRLIRQQFRFSSSEVERQLKHLLRDLSVIVEKPNVRRFGPYFLFDRQMTVPVDGLVEISKRVLRTRESGGLTLQKHQKQQYSKHHSKVLRWPDLSQ